MKNIQVWLATLLCAVSAYASADSVPLPRDSVYQLPVALIDHNGSRFSWDDRRGKVQLVSMFYTSCKYVCPLIVDSGKAIEKSLAAPERERLGILLISMDPRRDTPAALMQVVKQRSLDPARWTLAAPAAKQVRSLAGVLGIRFRALADGEFNHTSALVLLDAEGRVLARSERMGGQPDPVFLATVRSALAGNGSQTSALPKRGLAATLTRTEEGAGP